MTTKWKCFVRARSLFPTTKYYVPIKFNEENDGKNRIVIFGHPEFLKIMIKLTIIIDT